MAKSKRLPPFGKSAGAIFTVINSVIKEIKLYPLLLIIRKKHADRI
jgi:hypothetical protein